MGRWGCGREAAIRRLGGVANRSAWRTSATPVVTARLAFDPLVHVARADQEAVERGERRDLPGQQAEALALALVEVEQHIEHRRHDDGVLGGARLAQLVGRV